MAKNIILLCFALLSFYTSTAQNKLLEAERKRYTAMVSADTSALSSMLANSLVYIHSNGRIDSKASFLQSIASGELVHKAINTKNVVTRTYDKKFGIVTGSATYDINYQGKDMTLHFIFTNVYIKLKGQWILVSRQTCPDSVHAH